MLCLSDPYSLAGAVSFYLDCCPPRATG
jgi:hypothetical protein